MLLSLERSGHVFEMNLDYIRPTLPMYLLSSTTVASGRNFVIPPSGPITISDGHYWNDLRVHRLRNVVVDPTSALIFAGNKVITQSSYGWRSAADSAALSGAAVRARRIQDPPTVRGPIAPFGSVVFNYFFFLIHTLPRILHILSVEPRVTFTFTDPVPSHVRSALSALDINYEVVSDRPFKHDDVLICDPSRHAWPHPANIDRLNSLDVGGSIDTSSLPRRFYISRIGGARELVGESDFQEYLESRGFQMIRLEKLSWPEQVAHFRHAETVVATHGAGLANTAFMRPGSKVFELTTGVVWFPSMRNVSSMAGAQHHLVRLSYTPEFPYGTAQDAISAMKAVFGDHQL